MTRKSSRKLSASLMILSMILGQLSVIFPAWRTGEAYASDKVAVRKIGSTAGTEVAASRTDTGNDKEKKAHLTDARKKLGTNLLKLIDSNYLLPEESRDEVVARMKRLKQYFGNTDAVGPHSRTKTNEAHGTLVKVYVSLKDNAPTSVIDPYAWEVTRRSEEYHLAVALIETGKLEALASLPTVRTIKEVTPPRIRKGSVTAQGDLAHKTAEVRSAYGQQGNGVKIGVLSDGVDHIAQAKSSGDLPSNVVVLDNSFEGDEGTAMLEIIHDMAPGATLYFHQGGMDFLEFNEAYDELVRNGCKIIVDDLGWDSEPFFEDGLIEKHLSSILAAKDIVMVSAAGNEADRHYQGTYYDDGSGSHDFSRGSSSSKYMYATLAPGDWIYVALQWNDAFGASGNDYDLALYRKGTSTKLAGSTDTQNGDDDPYEYIDYTNNTSSTITVQVEVQKYSSASARILELYLWTAKDTLLATNVTPADCVYGHPNTKGMLAVGAVDAEDPGWDLIEYYSSRGPTTYRAETRNKPDLVGLDNVRVSGAGEFPDTFSGTSAAAPAVAAVVAQLWGAFPTLTGSVIRNALLASAVDLGAAGYDHTYGYGRADAARAYKLIVDGTQKSSEKAITFFALNGEAGNINEASHTISVNLPAGTSLTSLVPAINISPKAAISPTAGTARNFSAPVTYTVTAEDGTKQNYTVTVTVEAAPKSSAKAITFFALSGEAGIINETNHTISFTLPPGTNVTSLVPSITVSPKATVSPTSGTARSFSSPVAYTVTAEDGSKQAYTVTATVEAAPKSSAKQITSFILNGVPGTINQANRTISVSLLGNVNTSSLAPTITVSAKATVSPTSGTARNFSSPVTYTVTAEDGTRQNYTVTVSAPTLPKSSEKNILSFLLKGQTGVINETNRTITVTLPAGTSVSSLAPTITVSPKAAVNPASGVYKDFSIPVNYTVTAEDASSQIYSARAVVTSAQDTPSSAKDITNFILGGVTGNINETANTITVSFPQGTNVTSLVPDIFLSPMATVSPASGQAQNFTSPVRYTVTAEDGTLQTYTVTAIVATTNDGHPTGYVTYDITTPTNSNVVATLHLSEPVIMTSTGSKYHTFSENGSWTFTYKDADGNTGSTIAKVANIDKIAPVITLKGSSKISLKTGSPYLEEGATARDNMDGSVNVLATGAVNGNVPGTYTINYTARDDAGNAANATRTITVSGEGSPTTDDHPDTGSNEASIASFQFVSVDPDVVGIIDQTTRKILLTVPYGTNVTSLVPTIAFSKGANISPASGVAQNFSVSKTYTVTSESGTKQAYTVTVKIDASPTDTVNDSSNKVTITTGQKGVLTQNLTGGNKVQAEIPKGSVMSDTTFTIRPETLTANDTPDIRGAKLLSDLAFHIEAVDKNQVYIESLEETMTVTLTVPGLPKNTANLKVYYYDEARRNWAQVTSVTFGAGTITFLADYLATFAIFETQVTLPAGIVDGDIIQCKSSANPQAVYIVKIVGPNAYIRHIVSLEIFNYYKHLKWENLKQVGSLDPFSLSGWVRVNTGANGMPGPFDKVWEINGDQSKHWINMSAQDFLTHGGSEEAIYSINQGELNLYRVGPDVMSL